MASAPQRVGRSKERPFSRALRDSAAADTLISDFRPPELGENAFLLFHASQLVVIRYNSPRQLVH